MTLIIKVHCHASVEVGSSVDMGEIQEHKTTSWRNTKGEPRIAQWSLLKQRCDCDERLSFDDFDWRPYTKPLHNWNPLRLYVEEAMWVTVDNNLDDEFVAFARCVRSSQLVGIGFVEGYHPNRVAM
ncbi:hypothetical protein Bca52824_033601 [Brassica carinata]|uniref:Aminotransferase-like plant mobile domain-containing protein n=1 Tax=Brassica carinata TaxID=52824 RepID=A0A8X7V682_BRACI|nr:hypothetical protein Bca52824_033601 [Brassica carinata]